jgi:integrase
MANGFVTKKNSNYYIVIKRPEEGAPPKWISVKKELGLDRPAKHKEAQTLLRRKLEEIGELGYMVTTELTLAQFLEQWLASKTNLRESTRSSYDTMIRCHILPDDIAKIQLRKLTPLVTQTYFNRLADAGKSSRILHYTAAILKQAFQSAVTWELISRNPAAGVKLPQKTKQERLIWTDAEAATFLAAIQGDFLELFFIIAVSTGMRRGEILGLTWDCVDFERSRITINKSLNKARELTAPKTAKSIRTITMTPEITALLREHQRAQRENLFAAGVRNGYNAVFLTGNGTLYLPGNVLRHFKLICKKANLPEVDLHSLRHLYVSWMVDQDVDVKTIQNQVGHAEPSTTLSIYAHIFERQKEKAARAAADKIKSLRG